VKILVVGGGGREHALCWRLARSSQVRTLLCAPGNPGIAHLATNLPIPVEDVRGLADAAVQRGVDLVVVGPELALALGLADELERRGVPVFGPRRAAAEIEGSKVFAKQFMARHRIPTAPFAIARDEREARAAAAEFGFPVVLKADGLAAGKGVVLPENDAELDAALRGFFAERRFGASADRVVVERFERGEEVSFMALCAGERALALATSRDHKRLEDGDRGPNTGGMGAYSPSQRFDEAQSGEVMRTVIEPALAGLAAEGRPFVGVLYAGLMLTAEGLRVLEFNARFGDPEAQVVLLRLESDLADVLAAAAAGSLPREPLRFGRDAALGVVLASRGYPESPVKGEVIAGLERAARLPGVEIFHAATAARGDGAIVANGGRVLNATATGSTLAEARARAYAAAEAIDWPSKILRRDIGKGKGTGTGED
jgi:phosphoribosylamine--glycine ligase